TKNSAVGEKKQRNAKKQLSGIAVGLNLLGKYRAEQVRPCISGNQRPAQRMRQRFVDVHVDELADQSRVVAAEVDDAVVLGTALEHAGVLLGVIRDQDALSGACHPPAVLEALLVDALLQDCQALLLHLFGGLIGQIRRRRAGARAVDEGVGEVEADLLDQLHGLLEILVGLAGET